MSDTNQKDLLIIETMVKLAAVQKVLVKKGLLTDEEIQSQMTEISNDLVEQVKKINPELLASSIKN